MEYNLYAYEFIRIICKKWYNINLSFMLYWNTNNSVIIYYTF